ncbi:MAG: pyrroline-5-carboxylate reductase [Actinomycetota bacterium]|jgi:pyrroline-5-carboxylate reductase
MKTHALAVIGGGNMGIALVGGLISSGWIQASDLAIVEVLPEQRERLSQQFPGASVVDTVPPCAAAVIAVKPPDAPAAAAAATGAGATRLLSIAAGVSLATLEAAAGPSVAVIRSMPNTPALVGLGAAGMAGGSAASAADIEWATSILTAVGTVEIVPEYQLDAITGLVGSGPAFLFLIAEALIDAGVLNGLSRPASEALVSQLFLGSAAMLSQRGNPAQLRAMVTSPGGTTAAGLKVLEDLAVRAAMQSAVVAATERSRELGRPAR